MTHMEPALQLKKWRGSEEKKKEICIYQNKRKQADKFKNSG